MNQQKGFTMRHGEHGTRGATIGLAAVAILAAITACNGADPSQLGAPTGKDLAGGAVGDPGNPANMNPGPGGVAPGTGGTTGNSGADPAVKQNPNIDQRRVDYGEALRTATLKLAGDLPTLKDIQDIATAMTSADAGKSAYAAKVDALLADPRFADRQIEWWRDTFKTGNFDSMPKGAPSYDTAATFAASVVVSDRPYTDLFTASSGTCPTFANGTFTTADCAGAQPTAGVLTDPGLMAQYYANLAFRRVRFVQETFVCNKFPTEFSGAPQAMGAGLYTSPWSFDSISGGPNATVNFQDTSSVVCANCHTTLNHIAPLFAHFDDKGVYDPIAFQTHTPVPGTPKSVITDWLPDGQQTFAWRNGVAVTDLPSLGAAMAADPDVARCAVNRIWNYAMSRGDIVNDLATIPPVVTDPLLTDFKANGMKIKHVLKAAFTSDDFVKF